MFVSGCRLLLTTYDLQGTSYTYYLLLTTYTLRLTTYHLLLTLTTYHMLLTTSYYLRPLLTHTDTHNKQRERESRHRAEA